MTYLALMQTLGPEDANVVAEDQPLPDSGLWCDEIPIANYFADVPFPNPVSQEDGE